MSVYKSGYCMFHIVILSRINDYDTKIKYIKSNKVYGHRVCVGGKIIGAMQDWVLHPQLI